MTSKRAHDKAIGMVGYVRVLRTIARHHGRCTHRDVAREVGVTPHTAIRLLRSFEHAGLAHVRSWLDEPNGSGRTLLAQYKLGAGVSVPAPRKPGGVQPDPITELREQFARFAEAIKVLQQAPMNGVMLSEEAGISRSTAHRIVAALHAAKLIHIVEYQEKVGGALGEPMFRFGFEKKDLPKPPPKTRAELWARANEIKKRRQRMANALGLITARRRVTSLGFDLAGQACDL